MLSEGEDDTSGWSESSCAHALWQMLCTPVCCAAWNSQPSFFAFNILVNGCPCSTDAGISAQREPVQHSSQAHCQVVCVCSPRAQKALTFSPVFSAGRGLLKPPRLFMYCLACRVCLALMPPVLERLSSTCLPCTGLAERV